MSKINEHQTKGVYLLEGEFVLVKREVWDKIINRVKRKAREDMETIILNVIYDELVNKRPENPREDLADLIADAINKKVNKKSRKKLKEEE